MPYPLPQEPALGDLRWLLVAIPGGPDDLQVEYRRAALDAYTRLAQEYMWGLEGPERPDSYEAAQAWEQAIAETLRALEMGFPDILLSYIDEVEDKLDAIAAAIAMSSCCYPNPYDIPLNTDPAPEEGVGDVPAPVIGAGYAEDENDWSGWQDYKCDAAHAVVTIMTDQAQKIADAIETAGVISLGFLVILIGILAAGAVGAAAFILTLVSAATAATTLLLAIQALTDPDDISNFAQEFIDNHDALVCAIFQADGPDAAVAAVKDAIDENFSHPGLAAVAKLLMWDKWLATLYAGRWGDNDFAQFVRDSDVFGSICDCANPPLDNVSGVAGLLLANDGSTWLRGGVMANMVMQYEDDIFTQISHTTVFSAGAGDVGKTFAVATSSIPLDSIQKDIESVRDGGPGNILTLSFRNYFSTGPASTEWTLRITDVYRNGQWQPVSGLTVIYHQPGDTITVDGNLLHCDLNNVSQNSTVFVSLVVHGHSV